MQVACPYCRTLMIDDGGMAGMHVACPACSGQFQMPGAVVGHAISDYAFDREEIGYRPDAKNSGLAAVLSFFWPGLGQIYNGKIGKGILLMILQVICAVLILVLIGIPLLFILWIYGIYDAYNGAEKINARRRRR